MPSCFALAGRAALLAAGAWFLFGCAPSPTSTAPINVAVGLQAEYAAPNAAYPYALSAAADGRVFYTEKNTGQIRVIKDGALLPDPFATVPVNFADDRGLLGIALHPKFQFNGRVYVFYTRSDTGQSTADPQAAVDHRIVYFSAQDNGDVATSGETFVVSLPLGLDTQRIGGRLAFAPDGTLYVGFGDTTDQDAAQRVDLPWGKVLRYNDDGSIPADNPTAASPVYALGFADPRGLTFDPQSGGGFVLDRSPSGTCEIDLLQPGGNYGWPPVVGFAESSDELAFVAQTTGYVDPLYDSRGVELAGLWFNPSSKYGPGPLLQLFFGVRSAGETWHIGLTTDRTVLVGQQALFAHQFPVPLTDVGFTPAGTLYVATGGAVLRVVPVN